MTCIGSYLQFCRCSPNSSTNALCLAFEFIPMRQQQSAYRRAYDDSPQPVFGLSLARQSLAKHVFLVLFRM